MTIVKRMSKLTRVGNSTAVTLSREVLQTVGLARGDDVWVEINGKSVIIAKADSDRINSLEIGQRFMSRYSRTLAALAK